MSGSRERRFFFDFQTAVHTYLVTAAHLGELLLTVLALVGLDVSMPVQVLVQRLFASVALRTEVALKEAFASMHQGVPLQVALGQEL